MTMLDRIVGSLAVFQAEAQKPQFTDPDGHRFALFSKMNQEHAVRINTFLVNYRAIDDPERMLRRYRLEQQPYLSVFAKTHVNVLSLIDLLTAWSREQDQTQSVLARTGPLLVGEDEDDELQRLQRFHTAFVETFGTAGLPPSLQPDAVAAQVTAHLHAAREVPKAPAGQKLAEIRAERRRLTSEGQELFRIMHDFLDLYFGKKGDEAFRQKAAFGYDRRVLSSRGHGANHRAGAGSGGPARREDLPATSTNNWTAE